MGYYLFYTKNPRRKLKKRASRVIIINNQVKLKTKTMTFYYKTTTWGDSPSVNQETVDFWKHLAEKSNWRIVELPNGFFQTEYKDINCDCDPKKDPYCKDWHDVTRRESVEAAERAIDKSIDHYSRKLEFVKGPKVVKTFEK